MKSIKLFLLVVSLLLAASSCVTPKEVDYLQDLNPNRSIPLNSKFEAVICPYDQLRIIVRGYGVEKDMADPFNLTSINNQMNNQGMFDYLVDVNGDIQFPTLGVIHVKGMTRLELQDHIKNILISEKLMNNPMVDVRFTNFRVFVLGTADGGKVLNINNERCTFLEALAMMGGLNKFSKRDKVTVMREINGKMVTRYLDPRSSDVFNDPFFLLQQNDVIITHSFRRVYAQETLNTTISLISLAASLASTVSVIYLLFTNKQ